MRRPTYEVESRRDAIQGREVTDWMWVGTI